MFGDLANSWHKDINTIVRMFGILNASEVSKQGGAIQQQIFRVPSLKLTASLPL